jgi:hypothetical protein
MPSLRAQAAPMPLPAPMTIAAFTQPVLAPAEATS